MTGGRVLTLSKPEICLMVSVAVTSCANSPAAKKDGGVSEVEVPEANTLFVLLLELFSLLPRPLRFLVVRKNSRWQIPFPKTMKPLRLIRVSPSSVPLMRLPNFWQKLVA